MQRVVAVSMLSLVAAYAQPQASTKARHSTATSAQSTATKKTAARGHPSSAGTKQSASSRVSSTKGTARSRSQRGKGRRVRARAAPSYQLHPDPARYQQIQQALAERGYFKGQVNGEWGSDSIEALKKFQADQKLEDDGKINSLSLIGLGLGPKHDGTSGRTGPVPPAIPDSPVSIPPVSEPQSSQATPPQ